MHDIPLIRSANQLRSRVRSWRAFGETVALVPLQGGVHDGHLALVRRAQRDWDRVLGAIFQDPLDRPADLADDEYCPSEDRDAEALDREGVDALYAPAPRVFYPSGFQAEIRLPALTSVLCGEDEPHRFDGFVRTMVKMLGQAQPDAVILGARDWQKVAIARRLVADFDLPVKVAVAATERDMDDIAISSEAERLDAEGRAVARRLFRVLTRAADEIAAGAPADPALDAAADALADAGAEVEYLEMRDSETLEERSVVDEARPARIFAAIRIGDVRLIDNVPAAARG
ncbi:pantoate--beta-alanine ligase [Rhodovulum sp. DZ06]|uniref:pantoate--beta-alanine ligase n=1 Tax=Rhodovulum sp. DZ06 TaxID=3425126 RepID=UPI003D32CA02